MPRAMAARRRPPRLARLDGRAARRGRRAARRPATAPGRDVAVAAAAPQRERPHVRADRPRAGRAPPARPPRAAIAEHDPRAIVYSTITAALLWPRAGRDPLRRARRGEPARAATASGSARSSGGGCAPAPLLVPWRRRLAGRDAARRTRDAVVVPIPVEPSGLGDAAAGAERDIAAITYAAEPAQEGPRPRARRVGGARARGRGARRRGHRARRRPTRRGVRVAGRLRARGLPRAAAPRARLRHRAAPRGLRDRPARGARRRLRARHDAPRPARTPRSRSPARSTRGSSPTTSGRAALRAALDDPAPTATPSARSPRWRRSAAPPSTGPWSAELLPRSSPGCR